MRGGGARIRAGVECGEALSECSRCGSPRAQILIAGVGLQAVHLQAAGFMEPLGPVRECVGPSWVCIFFGCVLLAQLLGSCFVHSKIALISLVSDR